MKKAIETRLLKRWRLIDRLAWLIPVIMGLLLVWGGTASTFGGVMEQDPSIQTAALYIAVFLLTDVILSAPFFFLWRAVSRQIKKGYLQRSTIPLLQELDYYRDKLTGLSPTVISLLVDLQIEPEKDAAALILKYELMGAASMENGRFVVKNPDCPGLLPSDRMLLEQLAQGVAPGAAASNPRWVALAKQEAASTPCFQRSEVKTGCLVSGCLLPFLYFAGVMVLLWYAARQGWYQHFYAVLETLGDDTALLRALRTDPAFMRETFLFLLLAFLVFVAFFQPLISLARAAAIGFNLFKSGLKRTAYGDQMAEYVYGMKNFLHDFSNLSEADQDSLILWDDFLIYAVVLEENQRIVDQIMRKRNLRKPS